MRKVAYVYVDVKEGIESLPVYETEGSAGADIVSAVNFIIEPGEWFAVSTELYVKIPEGFEIQIRPRSGLAFKHGVTVLNAPGTIDSDYIGEIKVILINYGKERFCGMKGDRIAQMVVSQVVQARFDLVKNLEETERGIDGFGSTGI